MRRLLPNHSLLRTHTALGGVFRLLRIGVVLVFVSCGTDAVAPVPTSSPAALYWALTLDHHAVTLSTTSPYDTSRLTATPRDASGAPLGVPIAVTYQSTDLAHVGVSSDGVLQAVAPASQIQVVATLSLGNVTHVDTAVVNVTTDSSPPVLTSFSIHPVPPDSAIWDANALTPFFNVLGGKVLSAQLLDAAGNAIPGLAVDFRSSDPTIATIDPVSGTLTGMRPGRITIMASATAYGVTKADSVPFTITMPIINDMVVTQMDVGPVSFVANEVTIRQGGTILFADFTRQPVDIVFDDSTHVAQDSLICGCGAGNIPPFGADSTNFFADLTTRSFPTPGTYAFHSTLVPGLSGKIIVTDPPARAPAAATRTAVP